MSETRKLRVEVADGSVAEIAVEFSTHEPWIIWVSGLGTGACEFTGGDLFEALVALRTELERAGKRLICAGARIDSFPSGMSRSMGGGRRAYITRLGAPATETVDIFDTTSSDSVGTVSEQKAFHDQWVRSLTGAK
jgi:hypothetical protein